MKYTIAKGAKRGGATTIELNGHVDEDVREALTEIAGAVTTKRAVFDCAQIGKINSVGIKDWILAFDKLDEQFDTSYRRCPAAFIDVAVMVPSFAKARPILSFYTLFTCATCNAEASALVELVGGRGKAPVPPACVKCGTLMELDEDFAEDLEFLTTRGAKA